MRSRTPPELPGRCHTCILPERICLCPEVPRVETRTRILLIRHWKETLKSTNTARLAAMSLPNLVLTPYGAPDAPFDESLIPSEGAWVLFPDGGAKEIPDPPPKTLVVVDGTWKQARRIVHHVHGLRNMPRLALPPPLPGSRRLRQPTNADGMSTIEAVAQALRMLEGPEKAVPLEKLHRIQMQRVLSCRGESLPDEMSDHVGRP
jgi:DTW domain-containing protein YfiP